MKKRNSRRLLVDYVRECRKPGSGRPGYVFVLSRFARAIGVSRQQLRLWMNGEAVPSATRRLSLQKMTGGRVPASGWSD